jgi:hypothetical protein
MAYLAVMAFSLIPTIYTITCHNGGSEDALQVMISANERTNSPYETLSLSKYLKILFTNLTDILTYLLTYSMEQNPS